MSGIAGALGTFTQSTVNSYDPTTTAMNATQQTLSSIGGGIGGVVLSIPGIGKPTVEALNSLRKRAQQLLANARSMTPNKVQEENDKIKKDYENLVEEAKKKGEKPPERQTVYKKTETSVKSFFKEVFSTTLNIFLFFSVILFGIIGSSVAANSIGPGMPFYYYIYYIIYGFILFPVSIGIGIFNYYVNKKRPLIYAIIAPMFKGNYMGLFQYDLVTTNIVHYVSESTAKLLPSETEATTPVLRQSQSSRTVFEPTKVRV